MEEAFFQDPRHFYGNLRKQAKTHASVPLDSLTEYTKTNLRGDHSWEPGRAIDQSTGEWSYYWDYGFIQESEVEAALQATPNNVSVVGVLTPALMKRARQVANAGGHQDHAAQVCGGVHSSSVVGSLTCT